MSQKEREEALRSALGRLPMAVFVVDESRILRSLNDKAVALAERESLRGDLVAARPHHPLSTYVQSILDQSQSAKRQSQSMTLPSGRRIVVEASRRSERGVERWLILLIEEAREISAANLASSFDEWKLSTKEKEVARLMVLGNSSDEICTKMAIAPTTLKTHIGRILDKTGTRSRSEFLAKLIPD